MSTTSWFAVGLLAGAAIMLCATLLWRASRTASSRGRKVPLAALVSVITIAVAAGVSLAIHSSQEPGTAAAGPAAAPSAMPAMPASAAMPSAAMMAQVLGARGSNGTQTAEPMDKAAARLADRLERQGGTAADWNLLAQAYDFLGRPQDAQRARARAAAAGQSAAR